MNTKDDNWSPFHKLIYVNITLTLTKEKPIYFISWLCHNLKISFPLTEVLLLSEANHRLDVNPKFWFDSCAPATRPDHLPAAPARFINAVFDLDKEKRGAGMKGGRAEGREKHANMCPNTEIL